MRNALLAVLAALGLTACAAAAVGVAADKGRGITGPATYLGTYVWEESWRGFGGFSAIEVDDDGLGFTILSDRTLLVKGRFQRDGQGVVTGLQLDPLSMLPGEGGRRRLRGDFADSEGLAIAPDGTTYVSFELLPRVRREGRDGAPPEVLPPHPDFAGLGRNQALEALAVDADGTLYTMPEWPEDGTFPVYRFRDGAWDVAFRFAARGGLRVSGADIGPDGRLTVLERGFIGLGFRTRLRRFELDGSNEQTLIETGTGTHDNLEGIAVWADAEGLRATMISDDNFRFFQETQIVDYRLPD